MSTTLTPAQRDDVRRARALLAASAQGPAGLAALVEARTSQPVYNAGDPYPEAFGLAHNTIEDLLRVIDDLTGEEPPTHRGEGITGMYWDNLGSGGAS